MNVCLPGLRRSVAFVFLSALSPLAEAVPVPAISIGNVSGDTLSNPPFTLGWSFTTSDSVVVTQLGFFDAGLDGLGEEHEIGIWDEVGMLVAAATIDAGASGLLIDNFRYVGIVPVTLEAGAYTIGALFATGSEPLVFPGSATGFATSSLITFVASAYASGGVLARPDNLFGEDPAYFGPNFTFDDEVVVEAIPEPGTLLLIGSGITSLALRRWRSRRPPGL